MQVDVYPGSRTVGFRALALCLIFCNELWLFSWSGMFWSLFGLNTGFLPLWNDSKDPFSTVSWGMVKERKEWRAHEYSHLNSCGHSFLKNLGFSDFKKWPQWKLQYKSFYVFQTLELNSEIMYWAFIVADTFCPCHYLIQYLKKYFSKYFFAITGNSAQYIVVCRRSLWISYNGRFIWMGREDVSEAKDG